jgi:hypothetical protein
MAFYNLLGSNCVKKTSGLALCASLLALLAACAATPAAPGGAQVAQTTSSSDPEKVTCDSDVVTGSMVHQLTTCSTQAQQNQQAVDSIRDQVQIAPHNPR